MDGKLYEIKKNCNLSDFDFIVAKEALEILCLKDN